MVKRSPQILTSEDKATTRGDGDGDGGGGSYDCDDGCL